METSQPFLAIWSWLITWIAKKLVFFCLNGISCILICARCLFTFHWYYWKKYLSISLTISHWVLIHIDQTHQKFLFPSLNSQYLFIYQAFHPVCPCHFCTEEPELSPGFQISFTSAQQRGRTSSIAGEDLNTVQRVVGCLCNKDALLSHGQLVVH